MNVAKALRETTINDPTGCQRTIREGRIYHLSHHQIFPDHVNLTFLKDNREWNGSPLDWEIYALNPIG